MSSLLSDFPGQTPFDADGLINSDIKNKSDLDEAEAIGILRASNKYLKTRRKLGWFTGDFLLRVHREMFRDVWAWAGKYRDKDFKPNMGIAFHEVPVQVEELCRDIAFWAEMSKQPMPILEQAIRIHHKLVVIHPFRNGNGRHARLMSDIFLHANGQSSPSWPYDEILSEGTSRQSYILALRAADRGDYGPLIDYTRRYL